MVSVSHISISFNMISVVEISKLIIYCAGLVTVCILQTEQSKFISSLLYGILEKKAIHFAKLLTRRQSTKSDTQSRFVRSFSNHEKFSVLAWYNYSTVPFIEKNTKFTENSRIVVEYSAKRKKTTLHVRKIQKNIRDCLLKTSQN